MVTLHIENTVRDYDTWKGVFDKFDRFRADAGARSYRVSRQVEDGNKVAIDVEFDSVAEAESFREGLAQIWKTPQSQQELLSHRTPIIYEVAAEQQISAAAASTV